MILSSGVSRPIAMQAFAETAPQFSNSYFVPQTGLQLAQQYFTYGMMYQIQPHVFSVVEKIANLIARLGVSVWNTKPDSGDVLDRNGAYSRLMADPCLTVDKFAFYHWVATTYEIYGEAYLIKNRDPDTGKIVSFIPMHPTMTQIERDESGSLRYRFLGQPNNWMKESEVVPFRRYNPNNTMRGLSRLEPLRLTLKNEDGARRAQDSWWDKMGRPSMYLSTPKRLGPKGRDNLLAGIASTASGADNAGGIMILEDETTATAMQLNAEEMQYIESRKLNRGEVCMVYDIDPENIQIIDQTQRQSTIGKFKDVYKSSIDFRLKAIESVFDYYVGSEFNGERRMRFNVSQQLRGDVETLAPAAVQLVQSGIAKPAEVREWFDFDDAGALADELYANQALQPLGALSASAKADAMMGNTNHPDSGGLPTLPGVPNDTPPAATGDLPKHVPLLTDKSKKYMNEIGAAIGRGNGWEDTAKVLLDKHPGDGDDIRMACLYILERNR